MDLGFEGGFTVHKTALTKLERDSAKSFGKHGFVKLNSLPFATDFACDVSPKAMYAWNRFFSNRLFQHRSWECLWTLALASL